MGARMRAAWLRGTLLVAIACTATAQAIAQSVPNRYELGQRMRRFERSAEFWYGVQSPPPFGAGFGFFERFPEPTPTTPQATLLPTFSDAVGAYFQANPTRVAAALERGYGALLRCDSLASCTESEAEGHQAALQRAVGSFLRMPRFLDPASDAKVTLAWPPLLAETFSPDEGTASVIVSPEREFNLHIHTLEGVHRLTKDFYPQGDTWTLPLPEDWEAGDYWVRLDERVGEVWVEVGRQIVSWVPQSQPRVQRLRAFLETVEDFDPHQRATLEFQNSMLQAVTEGSAYETDVPIHRLLLEAESLRSAQSLATWLRGRSGELWLSVRGERDGQPKGRTHLRLFAPPMEQDAQRRPCVLALHGVGGSENMFFDGYGAGSIVDLCQERGWVLIAPRTGFTGIGIPLERLWEVLAEPLHIDRERILVVGHSMGARAALQVTRENVGLPYRAVAAIAGGGPKWSRPADDPTRFLVLTGSEDFALGQAKRLFERLQAAGADARYVELPGVEHLGAVPFGLPTVFAFFDEALGE